MVFLKELLKNKVESRRDSSRNLFHLLRLDFGSSSLELTGGDLRLTRELSCFFLDGVSEQYVEPFFFFLLSNEEKKLKYFLI